MNCPYHTLPPTSFWADAVANRSGSDLNPHLESRFRLSRDARIASAGSCFAQHISRALQSRAYNYYVTENAPAYLTAEQKERFNYGVFSARYGNIYTTLQLSQLFRRAFGLFKPVDQFWINSEGRVFDLLRPRIAPKGFVSMIEAEADVKQHLKAVRQLVETTSVFIFTLGLTECWVSKADGIVYPTCPGCGSAGEYDHSKYAFANLSVAETTDNLVDAINLMMSANPDIQIILTVSPVPLVATMEPRHVLQATTYSKSVLRVAAEEIVRRYENVHYFASYEIITAAKNAGTYFAGDGRAITENGVARAMELFFMHFADESDRVIHATSVAERGVDRSTTIDPGIICDEDDFYRALAASRPN